MWSVDQHGCEPWIQRCTEYVARNGMHCPLCDRYDFTVETIAAIKPL
jgi:hypothetical protein